MLLNDLLLKYEGYDKLDILGLDIMKFKNLRLFDQRYGHLFILKDIEKKFSELDSLSLEEIQELSKRLCKSLFDIDNIYYLPVEEAAKQVDELSDIETSKELYDRINALLKSIDAFDLPIVLKDFQFMQGSVQKPLIASPKHSSGDNAKIYFSHIELSDKLNLISACSLSHEIAHTQQEKNFGYATDILDREIIPIFLEKVIALEIDPTGNILRLMEKRRIRGIIDSFNRLYINPNIPLEEKAEIIMYIKSTLIALKLFDMYMSERKQKNKDKFLDDINKVFNGSITVEEMVSKRNITLSQCQDLNLIKRHII